ncbi:MAG: hypothetical protein H0U70_09305 [Tatlockia sp.]|nr:hypothetical protein [Tatlockia sp.]
MLLTKDQKKLIVKIDNDVKNILAQGANEFSLFSQLKNQIPFVKTMLFFAEKKEIDLYLYSYEGFHCYVNFLANNLSH